MYLSAVLVRVSLNGVIFACTQKINVLLMYRKDVKEPNFLGTASQRFIYLKTLNMLTLSIFKNACQSCVSCSGLFAPCFG